MIKKDTDIEKYSIRRPGFARHECTYIYKYRHTKHKNKIKEIDTIHRDTIQKNKFEVTVSQKHYFLYYFHRVIDNKWRLFPNS